MGLKGQYKEQWVQRTMGLKDSTKNNGFKGQYKEQWVQRTVQRTNKLRLKLSKSAYQLIVIQLKWVLKDSLSVTKY